MYFVVLSVYFSKSLLWLDFVMKPGWLLLHFSLLFLLCQVWIILNQMTVGHLIKYKNYAVNSDPALATLELNCILATTLLFGDWSLIIRTQVGQSMPENLWNPPKLSLYQPLRDHCCCRWRLRWKGEEN